MTTTNSSLDERVTVLETRLDTILPTLATKADVARLETRLDTILPTLATKEDVARLEGKMDAMNERLEGRIDGLEGKMDAMGNRLLIKLGGAGLAIAAIAVAAAKYL